MTCPDCPPVRAAREMAISDGELWTRLAIVLAPFLLVALIAFVVSRHLDRGAPHA